MEGDDVKEGEERNEGMRPQKGRKTREEKWKGQGAKREGRRKGGKKGWGRWKSGMR